MTPALFSGALTSIGVRVDRDQGQLRRGSRANGRLIVRIVLSALCQYCDAQRMLLINEAGNVMAINETGRVEGGV